MKIIIFFLSLFFVLSTYAQETINLEIRGVVTNSDIGKKESGVNVEVYLAGKKVGSGTTASNGKFDFKAAVPAGSTFEIVFSKSGLVSKRIRHNLAGISPEDLPSGNVFSILSDADIFAERPNTDFSFLNTEPVATFTLNTKKNVYEYDQSQASAMRTKIENLLAQAENKEKENELKYQAAIKDADAKFGTKDYEGALKKYEEAISYKPKEKYPSDKILELDALIQAKKKSELLTDQADSEYNNLIKAADNLRDQNKPKEAIAKYNEAITKKAEQYPKDQVAALTKLIEDEKKKLENKKAYDEAIVAGDMFFKQKSYKAAQDKYQAAQKLIPSEKYPADQLAKIDGFLKDQEDVNAKKKKYEEAVAAADALFDQEKWEEAKVKYQEAITYESAATYPGGKIKLIDEKLAGLAKEKEKADKIAKLLQQGDDNFKANKFPDSKLNYTEVLTLEATNQVAKDRLAEIEQKLLDEKNNAAKNAEFAKLVTEGDAADKIAKLDIAKTKYEEALKIKSDAGVQTKLDAVNKKINDQQNAAELKKQYDALIVEGNDLLKKNELEASKTKFQAALEIDNTQKLPKDKIAEIDALILKQKSANEKLEAYKKLIEEGEAALLAKELITAKTKYTEAQKLDPSQPIPPQKLKEIEKLILDNKSLADKDAKYQTLITDGEKLLIGSKLLESKAKFEEAKKIDPTQTLPDTKITEINALLADQNSKAEKELKIKTLLADGQKAIDKKDYTGAKTKYEEVLNLENSNSQATAKLAEVNGLIASLKSNEEKDQQFAALKKEGFALADEKKYQEAKTKLNEALSLKVDAETTAKLKLIDEAILKLNAQADLDKKYQDALNSGQTNENDDKLNEALAAYKLASTLKPNEQLPKDKIAALNGQLSNLSAQQKINTEYDALMKSAEKLVSNKDYLKAIAEYNKALALKPTEPKPAEEAKKLEVLLSQESNEEGKAQYEKLIAVANTKIESKDYPKAIELIERAEKINPTDVRLVEMRTKIKTIKDNEAAFDQAMKDGAKLVTENNLQGALAKYETAKTLNTMSPEPQKKIDEVNAKINAQKSAGEQEAEYQKNMSAGLSDFNTQNYTGALNYYKNALNIKKKDKAASDKISEISQILDDLANAQKNDAAKQKEINRLIAIADKLYDQKTWLAAKTAYEAVFTVDPTNKYAAGRRDDCLAMLELEKNREVEIEYQKIITAADKAFGELDYPKAKGYYERALTLKSADPYPKQKLAEIEAILNPPAVTEVALKPLGIPVDNSILEGSFLVQAELERQNSEQQEITKTYNEISDKNLESSNKKYEASKDNTLEINNTLRNVEDNINNNANDQKASLEVLRAEEAERKLLDDANQNYEQNQLNNANEKLTATNVQIEDDAKKNSNRNLENLDVLIEENKELAKAQEERQNASMNDVQETQQKLNTEIRNIEINYTDEDSRIASKEEIEAKLELNRVENENAQSDSYKKAQSNITKFDENEALIAEKNKYGYDNPLELNTQISESEKERQAAEQLSAEIKTQDIQDAKTKFKEIENTQSKENLNYLENKALTVEKFDENADKLLELEYQNYNKNLEKNLTSNDVLKEKQAANSAGTTYSVEKTYTARDQIAEIQEKERLETELMLQNSNEEIANTNELITATKDKELQNTDVQLLRQQAARDALLENEKLIAEENKKAAEAKRQAQLGNQETLNKNVTASPGTTKAKLKNSLGEDYPQGVSQEVFKLNDENGLMKSIITRRIVVDGDHGDVYVRTQTNFGTTYSKNGAPITQYQWNKETQDASLVRNY